MEEMLWFTLLHPTQPKAEHWDCWLTGTSSVVPIPAATHLPIGTHFLPPKAQYKHSASFILHQTLSGVAQDKQCLKPLQWKWCHQVTNLHWEAQQLVHGQHTRAPSQNCSYPPTAEEVLCAPSPSRSACLLPRYSSHWTSLRRAQEGVLPARCSHRKARREPFLSHVASQLILPDLATPRSHSMTHFPRSAMQMMALAASAWATSLFDLLFIWLIDKAVSRLFLGTGVLHPTPESSSALRNYDVKVKNEYVLKYFFP